MSAMGVTPAYAYSDLHRFVFVDIAGVGDPLLNQEIQRATSKFIRLSECWRETLTLGNMTSGYTFYFTYPTNGLTGVDLVTYSAFPKVPLLWVKIDGIEIKRQFYRVNNPIVKDGMFQLEFLEPLNQIGNGSVTARIAWRLRFDADPAPEWIYSQYGDIIATITRGALLSYVGKAWSNPEQGAIVSAQGVNQAHRVLAEMRLSDPMEFRP